MPQARFRSGLRMVFCGSCGGKIFVGLPIEGATISFAVLIAELQQSFLVSDSASHVIGNSDFGLSVADICSGIEAGLGGGHGLEE